MRRSVILFALSISPAAVTACSSSSSGNGSTPNGPDASSPDSSVVSDASVAVGSDAGVSCSGATCASGEVCCEARTSPTCTTMGACQGSFLSCTSTANCSGSQVCCFTFADDAGASTGMGPFTTECADSCSAPSYKLCASDSECSNGDTCVTGSYTTYCGTGGGIPGFDGNFPQFDGNFPFEEAGLEDTGTTPGVDAGDAGSTPDTGTSEQ
jgi:hypothetical protein